MSFKKQVVTYIALPLTLHSASVSAQDVQDSFKQRHERGAVEILEDKIAQGIENIEDAASWVWGYVKQGAEWAVDKYTEEMMERQVEDRLALSIADSTLVDYLDDHGADFDVNAELIGLSKDKLKAAFDVYADLKIDDAVLHRQYEFEVDGKNVEKILRVGRTWVERYGKEISLNDFSAIAKLYACVESEQEKRDTLLKVEIPGALMSYQLDPTAFKGLRSLSGSQYNPNDNPVIFSEDMRRAQVGISYTIEDIFENPVDSVKHYCVDEYKLSEEGWQYSRTILSAMYSGDLLIGAGENPYDREKSRLTSFREKVEGFFDKLF